MYEHYVSKKKYKKTLLNTNNTVYETLTFLIIYRLKFCIMIRQHVNVLRCNVKKNGNTLNIPVPDIRSRRFRSCYLVNITRITRNNLFIIWFHSPIVATSLTQSKTKNWLRSSNIVTSPENNSLGKFTYVLYNDMRCIM